MKKLEHSMYAGLLSATLLLTLLTGCGKTEEILEESSAAPESITEIIPEETEIPWESLLPQTDMEGMNFRVLTLTNGVVALTTLFQPEEETGELLNDSIYNRNLKIAELYNVKFSENGVGDYFTPSTMLKQAVIADSDEYDLYYLVEREAYSIILDKYALRPDQLPFVDPSQPWYFQDMNEQLSLNGILLMAYGADSITSYENSAIMLFNQQIFTNEGFENPYDMVRNGTWTVDKVLEIAETSARDLNGDGILNDYDQLGIVSELDFMYSSLWVGAEKPVVKILESIPTFMTLIDESLITLMQKISTYANMPGVMFDVFYDICDKYSEWQEISEPGRAVSDMIFSSGTAAMRITSIGALKNLREMEDNFGVLPLPKYDENQEKYHTRAIGGLYGTVPSTTQNANNISIILEALAAESYVSLMPAFCETVLKDKYTRDPDSQEMMDLILNNLYQDLGDAVFNKAFEPYNNLFAAGKDTFASETAKYEKQINTLITSYIEKAEKLYEDAE